MEWIATFDRAITAAARFITSPAGILVVCGLIVVAASSWYWLGFRRRISPLIRDLDNACAEIEQTSSAEEFAASFQDIDEKIAGNRLLADNWRQFQATLLWPEPDDDPQIIGCVQPPEYHFQRDGLLGRKLNLRLYNAIPNLLTGAGILGTFIGLVAGIYLASGGLASDRIEEAKAAMQALLNGASLAFITSIVGLVSSILFSIGEKHGVHRFDALLGRWIARLEARLQRVTPERLARDQLQQTRQQTQVIEGFTDQLAFQIAEAFDQKLQAHVAESIAPALTKLVDGIEGIRTDRQQSDEQMLGQLLSSFTGELKGAAGTEMDSLAQTLTQLNDNLKTQTEDAEKRHRESQQATQQSAEKLAELFNQGTTTFQQAVGQSVERMSTGVEAILDKLAEQQRQTATENAVRLKALSDAFDKAVGGLNRMLGQLKDITASNEEAATKVAELVEGLKAAAQELKGLSDPIETSADTFEATALQLTTQIEALKATAETIAGSTRQLEASNAQTQQSWQDYERRFEGIDEALGGAFTELSDGVQGFTTQVNDLLGQLDKHMGEISGLLAGANHDLGERVEELSDAIGRVKRS